MLGKYKESALSTVVGTVVCLLIGVFALTSAPTSVAQNAAISRDYLSSVTSLQAEVQVARFESTEVTLQVSASDQSGKVQDWTVVLPPPRELMAAGIKPVFFAPGRGYLITGSPSADPAARRLFALTVTRPDGTVWRRSE